MVPFRLRLEAERFKRGSYVFVQIAACVSGPPATPEPLCPIVRRLGPAFRFFCDTLITCQKRCHLCRIRSHIYDAFAIRACVVIYELRGVLRPRSTRGYHCSPLSSPCLTMKTITSQTDSWLNSRRPRSLSNINHMLRGGSRLYDSPNC